MGEVSTILSCINIFYSGNYTDANDFSEKEGFYLVNESRKETIGPVKGNLIPVRLIEFARGWNVLEDKIIAIDETDFKGFSRKVI